MFGARVLGGEEGRRGQQYVGVGYVWCVFKCALLGRGTRTVWEKREKETNAHSAGEREGEEYAQCGKREKERNAHSAGKEREGEEYAQCGKSRVGHSVLFRSVHYVLIRSKKKPAAAANACGTAPPTPFSRTAPPPRTAVTAAGQATFVTTTSPRFNSKFS